MGAMKFTAARCVRVTLNQLIIVLSLQFSSSQAQAKSVRVGGEQGWTSIDSATGLVRDYADWAASQVLFVQDSLGTKLIFVYL